MFISDFQGLRPDSDEPVLARNKILLDHERDLEDDRVVKLTQVKAGELLDLLKTVHQRISVDEELAGGLGDVQVVLKELVDGEQRLLIERIDGILLEHLGQEDLTERRRQLVDEAADAEVFIVDDRLFRLEDLADLDGDLRLFVCVSQLAQVTGDGGDADHGLDEQLGPERLLDGLGRLQKLCLLRAGGELLDDGDVRLVDGEDKVLLLVGEHAGQHVDGGHVGPADLPDEKDGARRVGDEMQLLGADIDVAGEDIVGDDVLDESALVVLFLVVGLRTVERDVGHDAEASGSLIVALGEHGIVKVGAPGNERLEGLFVDDNDGVRGAVELDDCLGPFFADQRGVAAGDHVAVSVNDADDAVGGLLHLDDHTLKNATGHSTPSLIFRQRRATCLRPALAFYTNNH